MTIINKLLETDNTAREIKVIVGKNTRQAAYDKYMGSSKSKF